VGWALSVGYLWFALRQSLGSNAMDARTLAFAILPLVFVELLAWSVTAWTPPLRRHLDGEWRHALAWSLVPNLMLVAAVALLNS
jgi:hypothetical protein